MKRKKKGNPSNRPMILNTFKIELLPAIFFTAGVILIVRLNLYDSPVKEFWWNQQANNLADFFNYYKMCAILIAASTAAFLFALGCYRRRIRIKQTLTYIPMIVYAVFILISFLFSDYKQFSLFGWEDRFEGTLVLLAYMVMLFYTINVVNRESDVKWIVYSVLTACCLLGFLGLSQGMGHDLFATEFGKKLIIPSEYWQYLDQVSFKFKNNEIYQTVYNINYVSFYLTLIVPLTGIMFASCESRKGKLIYALIFLLLIYNLLGASSSGGLLGVAVSCMMAIVIFGKKLLRRKKEAAVLAVLSVSLFVFNIGTLTPEIHNAVLSVFSGQSARQAHEVMTSAAGDSTGAAEKPSLEFIETNQDSIRMSLNNEIIEFQITNDKSTRNAKSLKIFDGDGSPVKIKTLDPVQSGHMYAVNDGRFSDCTIDFAKDGDSQYILVNLPGMTWTFLLGDKEILYRTSYGALVDLHKVEAFGFKGKEGFGSGRGYIWSRSLPLLKDTVIWGNGADTFAAYFPQDDFAGKYTGPSFSANINSVIRKPHSMYLGTAVNTGVISLAALLAVFMIYLVQSFSIYRKSGATDFVHRAGAGIFLGVCGFLTVGLVYDSNVCVMPLFYGLLGTGTAVNLKIIHHEQSEREVRYEK